MRLIGSCKNNSEQSQCKSHEISVVIVTVVDPYSVSEENINYFRSRLNDGNYTVGKY